MNVFSRQLDQEEKYSSQLFSQRVRDLVSGAGEASPVLKLVDELGLWIYGDHPYESKQERVKHLYGASLNKIIEEMLIILLPMEGTTTIQMVASQLASTDIWHRVPKVKKDAVRTCAEIICHLTQFTNLYDIVLSNGENGIQVVSNFPMNEQLQEEYDATMFVPPMLIPPRIRKRNGDTPFLVIKQHSISDPIARHDKYINLDALNIASQVAFKVYPSTFQYEHPLKPLDEANKKRMTPEDVQRRARNHITKCRQTFEIAKELYDNDSEFYFSYFYDSRGRMYPSGYHLTSNGDDYEKACIVLAKSKKVSGVPDV